MSDELINFYLPVERSSIIKVLGIGGGGNNAVNHMFERGIKDVNFIVCNTDLQALSESAVPVKVEIGEALTEGRGAGSRPSIGRQAAVESISDVMDALSGNTRMVFITTGMGGGTGTGATPVIAKACREAGFLTIAVVTIPFKSEGKIRISHAVEGVNELKEHVDSLLIINNEKLRDIYGDQPVSLAFAKADDVLATAVKGIAEIITVAGYINVDFADVETVMRSSGVAVMGMGRASGESRAVEAIEAALTSPLLNSSDITGAKSILLNISSGGGDSEITMDELGEITDYIYDVASDDALIIRGLSRDDSLEDEISVIVIATGFESNSVIEPYKAPVKRETVQLSQTCSVPSGGADRGTAPESQRDELFKIKDKSDSVVARLGDDRVQGRLDFRSQEGEESPAAREAGDDDPDDEREGNTLSKVKEVQGLLKRHGLTNKTITENIDVFEDVPAFVRRNINLRKGDVKRSQVSKLTLSSDDAEQPVIRDDNAYLNDNVD